MNQESGIASVANGEVSISYYRISIVSLSYQYRIGIVSTVYNFLNYQISQGLWFINCEKLSILNVHDTATCF